MFNNLGAIGNYTAPGAFKGQTFNTYTGGNLYLRAPNKTYQLAAVQFPSAKGGCGGIDLFGGSFSHISAAEFKNMLRNITAALPGIAFQLALEAVSPLLGGLTKWAKGLETWINNARINSCETATALVASAAEATGYGSQRACAKLAMTMGLETDIDAAMRRCASDSPSILASARSNPDPNIAQPGALRWQPDLEGAEDRRHARRPCARGRHEHRRARSSSTPKRPTATPSTSARASPPSLTCCTGSRMPVGATSTSSS